MGLERMMTPEFTNALDSRAAAAAVLMQAAHDLTSALGKFNAASDIVLQEIPRLALRVGERAKANHSSQWSDYAGTAAEAAQRKHAAIAAGRGAAGNVEHKLCQAFANGFGRGSPAETLGLEFSTEAGAFLRAAADVAAQRAPRTKPDGRFVSIITAQSERLRELTQKFT
jgi:hypothetical protein